MLKFCRNCGNENAESALYCARCGTPLESAAPAEVTPAYAGFWLRFVATLIDAIVLSIVGALSLFEPVSNLLISWLYYSLMESSRYQGTLGKMALRIKVTTLAGQRVSFPRATARYFAKYLSLVTLFIGFIMAAFTERKQALHDLIAECLVVREKL